jgi:hypothetical protein
MFLRRSISVFVLMALFCVILVGCESAKEKVQQVDQGVRDVLW